MDLIETLRIHQIALIKAQEDSNSAHGEAIGPLADRIHRLREELGVHQYRVAGKVRSHIPSAGCEGAR